MSGNVLDALMSHDHAEVHQHRQRAVWTFRCCSSKGYTIGDNAYLAYAHTEDSGAAAAAAVVTTGGTRMGWPSPSVVPAPLATASTS